MNCSNIQRSRHYRNECISYVRGVKTRNSTIDADGTRGNIPLSYAQQRLWFIDQFAPNSALYNMPMVCRLTGNWLPEALELGWNQLIERHESLRTVFYEEDGHPVQRDSTVRFPSASTNGLN